MCICYPIITGLLPHYKYRTNVITHNECECLKHKVTVIDKQCADSSDNYQSS
jgi:hypothetical protein